MNNLPSLPRVLKKREARFSLRFREWIMSHPQFSGSYEIKDSRGKDYINFSEITDEQLNYGRAITGDEGVLIRVQGLAGEPDYVYLRNADAYVVVKYPNFFVIIKIDMLVREKVMSSKKSLTASRAKEIAHTIVNL